MKILGICASPRGSKSTTKRLVQATLDGAAAKGATIELVDVCGLDIKYCNACQVCLKKASAHTKMTSRVSTTRFWRLTAWLGIAQLFPYRDGADENFH